VFISAACPEDPDLLSEFSTRTIEDAPTDSSEDDGRPLRPALVSPCWPPDQDANGVTSYVADLTSGMRDQGHEPTVLAMSAPAGRDNESFYDVGRIGESLRRSPVHRASDRLWRAVSPEASRDRATTRSLVEATRRAVVERGVEILEMEEAFGWARWVKPRITIPLVVRLHGPWFINGPLISAREDASFRRRVEHERIALLEADAVTAPSQDVLDRTRAYYGLPLDQAVVIPNPAPVVGRERQWRRDDCDRWLILFVGRFDLTKGGDVVIDAFARLSARAPEARLRFVGPDLGLTDKHGRRWTLPEYLAERAPEAMAAGRIEWLGQRPRSTLADLRRQAFLTVVASRSETFGIVAAEAMVQGCPLVATRAGAIAEVVEDGVTGLLCRPDDAADLAATLERLLLDPARSARLGAQAAEVATRRYHPAVLARQTAAFYRRTLARSGRRAERTRRP
jgi:glycosyltransferase involved in cell wall biosynthesis